jgi:hypothetical protein
MALNVQLSWIPVLAHGALAASGSSVALVFCVLSRASLPRAHYRLDEGRFALPPRYGRRVSQNCWR